MMMAELIFAEAAPTAAQWNGFYVVATALVVVAANVTAIWAALRKQKREIHFGFEPASKVEFETMVKRNEREHENLFSKIGGVERGQSAKLDAKFAELSKDAHDGREKIHDRINVVLKAVSRLEGKIESRHGDD